MALSTRHDRDDVLAVSACLREAIRAKDVAVAVSLTTDDVLLVGLAGPPVVGRDAARAALSVKPRLGYDVQETTTDITVEVLGDTAIVTRSASVRPTRERGALPLIEMHGRIISVFRRQVDGWKLARWLNLLAKVKS